MGAYDVLKFDNTVSCPTPTALMHPQTIMLPSPCFTVATVLEGTYSSPRFLQTLKFARVGFSWKLDSFYHIIFAEGACIHWRCSSSHRNLALLCFSFINSYFFLAIHDLKPCFKSFLRTDWIPDCSDHSRFGSGAVFFLSVLYRRSRTQSSLAVLHLARPLLGSSFRLLDCCNFLMIILAVVCIHPHFVAIW